MDTTTPGARLDTLRASRDTALNARGALLDGAVLAGRGLTDEEKANHKRLSDQIDTLDLRIADVTAETAAAEAAETAARAAAAAAHHATADGIPAQRGGALVKDAPVYAPGGGTGNSYFRDLYRAQMKGDADARDRLVRNTAMTRDYEARALGNTNLVPGSGQEFAPPEWMISQWIKYLRAGRTTANLFTSHPVPMGVSSINIPKITGGSAAALQATQNTGLQQTDITTNAVSTGFATIGGTETISQQLLDQSAIPLDDVIAQDLVAEYTRALGYQVLLGPGTGANNNSAVNGLYNVTGIPATSVVNAPANMTVGQFWTKLSGLIASFVTNRYDSPTHLLMHPRRWYYLASQLDGNGRPLVVPDASSFNAMANETSPGAAQGYVGTIQGIPVVIDPQHPITLAAPTGGQTGTQLTGGTFDRVTLVKADDFMLFESPLRSEVFPQPLATSVSVVFRLYGYLGTILNRYPASIAVLDQIPAPTF